MTATLTADATATTTGRHHLILNGWRYCFSTAIGQPWVSVLRIRDFDGRQFDRWAVSVKDARRRYQDLLNAGAARW